MLIKAKMKVKVFLITLFLRLVLILETSLQSGVSHSNYHSLSLCLLQFNLLLHFIHVKCDRIRESGSLESTPALTARVFYSGSPIYGQTFKILLSINRLTVP